MDSESQEKDRTNEERQEKKTNHAADPSNDGREKGVRGGGSRKYGGTVF